MGRDNMDGFNTSNPYVSEDYWKDRGMESSTPPTGSAERFEEPSTDPFAPENVGTVNAIMLMRIYDVLMAQLTTADPERARDLLDMHRQGTIFGSIPSLNGTFVTDIVNGEEDDATT